jgi:hypothetical protein
VGVRLLGIALSHFGEEDQTAPPQLGLFPTPPAPAPPDEPVEDERDRALTRALDRIRHRYGQAAIVPAALVDPSNDPGPRVEE